MKPNKLALALAGLLLTPAASVLAQTATPPADAPPQQAQAKQLETITVTGSALPRVDTETPSPVTTITAAQIQRSGLTTVSDVVRAISADNSGSIPNCVHRGLCRRFGRCRAAWPHGRLDPGADRWAAQRQLCTGRRRSAHVRRSQHHTDQCDRADRGAQGWCLVDLRCRCDRRRRQRHPQAELQGRRGHRRGRYVRARRRIYPKVYRHPGRGRPEQGWPQRLCERGISEGQRDHES